MSHHQQRLFLKDEITSKGQFINIDNSEKFQTTCLFGQQNVYNLKLEICLVVQFSQEQDY